MRRYLLALCALPFLGAQDSAEPPRTAEAQAKLDKILAGRMVGEPRRCLYVHQVLHPISIDDNTLVFRDGPRIWLNRVQASDGCGRLGPQSGVGYESHMGYVCSGDRLLFSNGLERNVSLLGEFEPYTKEK